MITASLVLLGMVAFMIAGVPIGIAILASGMVGLFAHGGMLGLYTAALAMYDGASSFPLIAIPLFVLAGALMNTTGISRRLIAFVSALVGYVRGALAMVTIGVSMFFAEIS
ncbi:MAG: TRAP transporter large permease subunit, partial [Betaproteobacteria bacterium]